MISINNKCFGAISIIISITACDQSEPPDSKQADSEVADSKTPDVLDDVLSDDYYPLVDRATWTYRHSSKNGWEETVTMRRSDDDENTYITSDTPDPTGERTESTLVLDDTSVYRVSKQVFLNNEPQFSAVYDPGFLRFDIGWPDKEESYEDTRTYRRTETETGQSPKEPRDREHTYVVEEKNVEVTVTGKIFRNCIVIRRKKEVILDETGEVDSDAQDKRYWFAPNVGKVQEINLDTGNSEQLIEYDIPKR